MARPRTVKAGVRTSKERVSIGGRAIDLTVRVDPRARRILLRLDRTSGNPVVVVPDARHVDRGIAFARSRGDWLLPRIEAVPAPVPFRPGESIPLLGVEREIRHAPRSADPLRVEADAIVVGGPETRVPEQVARYLKMRALQEIRERVGRTTARAGLTAGRIAVRDTRSRWGSCSAQGNLSFSWRIVMAPETVLDYLVVHEVAHLRHHDHSIRFWRQVAALDPDWKASERWLKRHGPGLHRYGRECDDGADADRPDVGQRGESHARRQ